MYPNYGARVAPFDKSTTPRKVMSIQPEKKFDDKNSTFIDEISLPEERSVNYEPSDFCAKNVYRFAAQDYVQQQIRSISPDISMRSPYILVSDTPTGTKKNNQK
jgi:hypothetical protein